MGFATSGLSGLSNAGKPKHSFVIAVRRAKGIDKIAAPQQTSSPENSRQRNQTRVISVKPDGVAAASSRTISANTLELGLLI
jgi:hypothetical protein